MKLRRAVAFDLDGTLLDTLGDLATSVNAVVMKEGYREVTHEEFKIFVGSGVRELFNRLLASQEAVLPPAEKEALLTRWTNEFRQVYNEHLLDTTKPYPGIERLISDLKQAGIPMAVLTNKPEEAAKKLIYSSFPEGTFCAVLGMRPELQPKPARSYAARLEEETGIPLEDWWMVGDSDVDMLTAVNSGMGAIGVTWGFRSVEELQRAGAKALLNKPHDFTWMVG